MNKFFKKIYAFLLSSILLCSCDNSQGKYNFELEEGDLLFQNTGASEIDNAIKDVTATAFAKNYSHVGMAMQENRKWFILEAVPKEGVCKTPLKAFLERNVNQFNKSQTTVARLEGCYQPYISKAIAYGLERIDTPYDEIFLWDNQSYYCSELIYKMFSSQDLPVDSIPFATHPMTFNDSTGSPLSSWVTYYRDLNHDIPEGVEGTNPNLMASSPHIKFVHDYQNQ
ncbi:MAG: hypothetical protein MK207_06545 [Saprospiraceae bacterium]|nr:hypothetical protein [Saprospiraceae bacterium]